MKEVSFLKNSNVSTTGCGTLKDNSLWYEIYRHRAKYFMLLPFFSLFFIFTVLPVGSSLLLGFTSFNMVQPPEFTGWLNYVRLFLDDEVFLISLKNTIIFAVLTGPISYIACLFFAWLINELPHTLRYIMTFIFYAPSISGNLFVVWGYIFSSDSYGFINSTMINIGLINEPIKWLQDPKYDLMVLIIVQLWASLGTSFLAFIAGLQGVDRNLYEAGAIDGIRNRFQELIYITIPSMGPMLLFGAVMQIGTSFAVSGISIQLAGLPSTDYSASTIVTHIIDYGTLRFEMGYASAIATVLFISMITFNWFIRKLLSKVLD